MASSTSQATPAPAGRFGRIFGSPRGQRRLFWASGGILIVGIGAFLTVFIIHGHGVQNAPYNSQKVQTTPPLPKTVKADPAAFAVARQFLQTAVTRQHVDASWNLVAPSLKYGFTRKQWDTGNIPVTFYPAKNAKRTGLTILWSHPKALYLSLQLLPKRGYPSIQPASFDLRVVKIHHKWLVNYFIDNYQLPVPQGGGG